LKFDEEMENWTGRIRLPTLEMCRMNWWLTSRGELRDWSADAEAPKDGLSISVTDAKGDRSGPGPLQRAALTSLRANESAVTSKVLAEIARFASETYLDPEQIPKGCPVLTSQKSLADRLCTPAGVIEWLSAPGVDFHRTGAGGVAYVSFNFGAGFDDDHGVAVLMHKDKFVELGGSGDLYDR